MHVDVTKNCTTMHYYNSLLHAARNCVYVTMHMCYIVTQCQTSLGLSLFAFEITNYYAFEAMLQIFAYCAPIMLLKKGITILQNLSCHLG